MPRQYQAWAAPAYRANFGEQNTVRHGFDGAVPPLQRVKHFR